MHMGTVIVGDEPLWHLSGYILHAKIKITVSACSSSSVIVCKKKPFSRGQNPKLLANIETRYEFQSMNFSVGIFRSVSIWNNNGR